MKRFDFTFASKTPSLFSGRITEGDNEVARFEFTPNNFQMMSNVKAYHMTQEAWNKLFDYISVMFKGMQNDVFFWL